MVEILFPNGQVFACLVFVDDPILGIIPWNGAGGSGGGGAVTIADGADIVEGAIADASVVGDTAGTVSAKLRGINIKLADIDSILSAASLGFGPLFVSDSLVSNTVGNVQVFIGSIANPTKLDIIGGLSNDSPGQYFPLPEGPLGRSVIIEGIAGGVAIPISSASLPLPTGAATEATQLLVKAKTDNLDVALSTRLKPADTLAAVTSITNPVAVTNAGITSIDTKTPALGQALAAASTPVVLTAIQVAALTPPAAITGFALEATQTSRAAKSQITDGTRDGTVKAASTLPVATDTALVVTLRESLSTPVTGTVSTTPPANASENITQFGGNAVVTGTGAGGNGIPRVTVSNDSNVIITPPTLTKGTQGVTGLSIQALKDAGRNTRIFMLDAITAAPLVEALATVVQWYGNAAVAGTTQPAIVPAGKTLRLTGYKIQYQSLATVGYAVVRIRFNTGGLVVLGSPLVASFEAGSGSGATTAAMTGGVTTETGSFPEGLELPAAGGIGFSFAGYGPTGALTLEGGVRFEVHGYEY